ncbi:MAG: tail fiber domain-containing protein, partial [Verrucomicrobiota bacterium]
FGGFIGDGSTLVALNAAQLASGTVPDARLAGNVARLNATNQTYTGTNTFTGVLIATNANNVIGGTFTGSGAGLTQLNGSVLATGSVGNGALAAASVTADKLAAGQVVKSVNGLRDAVTLTAGANIALATNGNSLQISAAGAAAPWSLTGNSGNSGNIFLGTTDYTPLELRVNNTRALLIQMNYQDGNYSAQMVGGSPANFIAPGVIGSVVVGGGINNYYYLGNNYTNSVSSDFSFLGGGLGNSIQYGGYISFLGGGSENSIQPYVEYAFLGGGFGNAIQPYASRSFLGGGFFNSIQMNANYSFLGGGSYNSIQTNANYSFLGGGSQNSIQPYADGSFLGGGYNNSIQANAYDSFLGGGEFNTNGAVYSVVPGGDRNYAGGQNSFAAGHRAKANFAGDFVWADSQDADFNATATNQFSVRAAGGVQFVTAGSGLTIDGPVIATAIAGNGGGLTNLTVPVAALSGTLADAQLSANIARLNAGQTFTGNQTVAGNLVVSPGNGTLTVTNDGGVIPGLVASGGGAPGHLRFRNYLEIFPNFANTAAGALDVRNTNGTATLTLDGQTGSLTGDTSFVRQILNLYGSGYGIGVQRLTTYFRSGGGYAWFNGGAHNDNQNNSGGGTTLMTLDSSGNVSAASFNGAFIGGTGNTTPASDPLSVVSGGLNNAIQTGASKSVIAGGEQNLIQTNSDHAAIGGGWLNFIGQNNYEAAIASGYQNGISNNAGYSLIGGGQGNTIMFGSDHSVIAGGVYNYINTNAAYSFIGGGYNQNILGNAEYSSIGGGWGSACGGAYSTVPGGRGNFAGGQYSFAAGYRAKATNNGAFVWSDGTGTITSSTNDNQFVARASGGVIFYSSTGSSGVSLAAGSGTWSSMSDRNAKEQFQQVNPQAVLARVSALPMTTWSYKTEPGVRHVGPMAQDFYAAFAVGPDDKHITTVDESGVALAAIQGLNQKVEDRSQNSEVRIQKLETENAELKQQLAGLKAMVEKLAGKIGR